MPAPVRAPVRQPTSAQQLPVKVEEAESPSGRSLFFGVERLFGASHATSHSDGSYRLDEREATISGLAVVGIDQPLRLGADLVFGDWFTLGAVIGYGTRAEALRVEDEPYPNAGSTSLVAGGRLGFVVPIASALDLWLRGGLTHTRLTSEVEAQTWRDSNRISVTELSLEATLLLKPASVWAISLGVFSDRSVKGEVRALYDDLVNDAHDYIDTTSTRRDGYGVALGLVAWL